MAKTLGEAEALGLTKAKTATDFSESDATNEVIVLSKGTGTLSAFDEKGLILESNYVYLPRIPLNSLNNDEAQSLLKCKLAYLTLTYFDRLHYKTNNNSDQSDHYAEVMWQIWTNGNSLQERIQTRLKIFNEMSEYNADTKSYQKYIQAYMDYTDKKAKKYDPLYPPPPDGMVVDLSGQTEMIGRMEMNDPLSKLQDSASDQASVFASRINKCVALLSSVGIDVPGVPTDPTAPLYPAFVIIPPFQCRVK